MKKKILFLIHDLSVGGAEKVLVNLVNHMDREKFDITVMALFGGGVNEKFLAKDIRYQVAFSKPFPGNSKLMLLFSPEQLHRKFIREKYDIEVSYLEGPSARIISGCPNPDTKLVCWIHVEQHTKEIAAMSFRSFAESEKCYNRFDQVIGVSEYVVKDFTGLYPHLKRMDVLYNTNETEQILLQKTESVEDGIFHEDEFKIIGVGKVVPVKGFDKLARIHKRLKEENYPVHTYVLGVGDDREKIESYLKENHLEDSFTFLGYQTNPYKYVSRCQLFVCASVAEGFSTAATEALIVGTPVVTTEVSGMKEMLGSSNEYGIVTDNNEEALYQGIRTMLEKPEVYRFYKEAAGERGKFFRTENTVAAVEEMLQKL